MAQDTSPRLGLRFLAAAQAQKHVTLNEALLRLDALVQTAVESRVTPPPATGAPDGAAYIVPDPGFASVPSAEPGDMVVADAGDWLHVAPGEGWIVYVRDEGAILVRSDGAWRPAGDRLGEVGNLARLGVGTTADAETPFAIKANAGLFTARATSEGGDGDFRLTLNKAAPAGHGSLLFQTGYSGRAEIGLTGDDAFHVKVSANGTDWLDALRIEPDGAVSLTGTAATSGDYGVVCTASTAQFPTAMVIQESTHATSRRAGLLIGVWAVGQDAGGVGERDLFFFSPSRGVSQLRLPAAGGLEVEGVRIAAPGGDLTPRSVSLAALGSAAPAGRLRLVSDRGYRPAVSDGAVWRWADGTAAS